MQFASGTQINVEKLSQHTKEVGAKLVIDITQAAGAVPISINDWAIDILHAVATNGWEATGYCLGWFSDEILKLDPLQSAGSVTKTLDMEATKLNLSKTAAKYTQSTLSYVSVVGLMLR